MNDEAVPSAAGDAEQDPRPVVRLPAAGLPGIAIAAIGAVVAVALFVTVEQARTARAVRPQPVAPGAFTPVPPLVVPPATPRPEPTPATLAAPPPVPPPASPPMVRTVEPAQIYRPVPSYPPMPPDAPSVARPLAGRLPRVNDQALVIDGGVEMPVTPTAEHNSAAPAAAATGAGGDDAAARASVLGNPTTTMPTGTIIAAVLETPIDTARPGLARAIVAEDALGYDGTRVLVPRGSRLIGEFQADVRPGQNRVLVTWTRLIRADGATIRLGSPAADALGGAGVPGHVHSFFFERFTAAVLQSALAVGVNLASRSGSGSVIVEAPGQGLGNAVGQQLLPSGDLKPKITIRAGALVDVFVAHDLDFSGVPAVKRRTS